MNISTVWARLARKDIQYLLGRFYFARKAYSRFRRLFQSPFDVPANGDRPPTLFTGIDLDTAVAAIRRDSVFAGLTLPVSIVQEIYSFCCEQPLFARHEPDGGLFLYQDIHNGYRPDGRPVPLGAIRDPLRCDAVRTVTSDPLLRHMVRQYLGYEPRHVMTLLYWSFCSTFSAADRRSMLQHVIDYHYDVGGYNFVYASFYLTDTIRDSGAHVMMKRSHRGKSLKMLFGSTVATTQAVHQRFGRENEWVIEGPAGTGFIEDTSCYHHASPPTSGDRLMLQIRFS